MLQNFYFVACYTLNKYEQRNWDIFIFCIGGGVKKPLKVVLTHTNIAIVSSSRTSSRAPISAHVTSGIVTKPSLLAEGCTDDNATIKSFISMHSVCSCSSGKGSCFFSKSKSLCNSTWVNSRKKNGRENSRKKIMQAIF